MRSVLVLLLLGLLVPHALAAEARSEGRRFGAELTLASPTPLGEILAAPERFSQTRVLVSGRLTDLCMKKGCWTVLADGDAFVRVRFQDYGFFLPQDALGAQALVEGVATVRTLSEREAKHLAEESRDGDPDAIEGPQRSVEFIASGVRLVAATRE